MSVAVGANGYAHGSRRLAIEPLRGALLWLMGFAGAFVFIEPSPYEFVGFVTIFLFGLTGLSMRPALAPLIVLLLLLTAGYAASLVQVVDQVNAVIWVVVSTFLALSAIFFAAMLTTNTEARLAWLLRGYIAAAVVTSLLAIAGYFHLLGSSSDLFVIYERARGTFKDPNVLGAFLVLPALLVFQRVLSGKPRAVIGSGCILLVILAAIMLSFSRAALAQFAFTAMLVMSMTFITSRSASERARLLLIAFLGALVIALLVAALLSVGKVADLFSARASLELEYDAGHFGRFGRYILAAEVALDHPFGVGPLQFTRPEAPHNVYLNSFMSGGWLSGFAYFTLTAITVVMGLRYAFIATPWRATYHAVYAAYLGVVFESVIIDSDHWRHYFLILGVLWGLMVATRARLPIGRDRESPGVLPMPAAARPI
jgi:hypothetical protein